jgi:hypothetical protein
VSPANAHRAFNHFDGRAGRRSNGPRFQMKNRLDALTGLRQGRNYGQQKKSRKNRAHENLIATA